MKVCSNPACESPGPFYKDRTKADGLSSYCKECDNYRVKKSWDSVESDERKRRKRQAHLLRSYGIDWDSYTELIADGCAICGTHEDLCVDHDHDTMVVRGALCDRCNRGLGCFRDDPELLHQALEYLEAAKALA